jgi:hypothetical protein
LRDSNRTCGQISTPTDKSDESSTGANEHRRRRRRSGSGTRQAEQLERASSPPDRFRDGATDVLSLERDRQLTLLQTRQCGGSPVGIPKRLPDDRQQLIDVRIIRGIVTQRLGNLHLRNASGLGGGNNRREWSRCFAHLEILPRIPHVMHPHH